MQTPAQVGYNFHTYALSEQAVTMEFGQMISDETLEQINNFNNLLHQRPFPGFHTTVPAYATLTVFYDPLLVMISNAMVGLSCFEKVSRYLNSINSIPHNIPVLTYETVTIPVCYGGAFGPDLEELAALHNLTPQEVINLHAAPVYKVYMIGFVPGFAYLGGMDFRLETPRRLAPRNDIPAGAVGIAGKQTGVYPLKTPGGWQIIGRTPLQLFNAERPQPSLLKAGDNVIFKAIDRQEFDYLANN